MSVHFGPTNDDERSYTFSGVDLAASSEWCLGLIVHLDTVRSYALNEVRFLMGLANVTDAMSGGNDWGVSFYEANHTTSGNRLKLGFGMRRGGQSLFASPNETPVIKLGSTALERGKSYLVVLQRRDDTGGSGNWLAEMITCELGSGKTAVTQVSVTANSGFQNNGTGLTWEIGQNWRNPSSDFFCAVGNSLSTAQIEAIAADPTLLKDITYIPSANRETYLAFETDAATITDEWGSNDASQVGTWTEPRTAGDLWNDAGTDWIRGRRDDFQPFRNIPADPSSSTVTRRYTLDYDSLFSVVGVAYRILNTSGGTVTDWTSMSNGANDAVAYTYTGDVSIPRGGPYYIEFRSTADTSVTWAPGTPFVSEPGVVTFGQSPMAYIEGVYDGALSDTVNPILFDRSQVEWAEFTGSTTNLGAIGSQGEHGSGYAAAGNQWASVTSNERIAFIPTALGGTSSYEWAGVQKPTLSGISGTFQVGETVTASGGGTAVVTSISGTDLEVEWSDKWFRTAETITGGTSGATATIATEDALPTLIETTYPRMLQAIDDAGYGSGDVVYLYWLQGSADNTFSTEAEIKGYLDSLQRRLASDLGTDRSIDWYWVICPHNRDTGGTAPAQHRVREAQYDFALTDSTEAGSRVLLGPNFIDMETDADPSSTSPHPSDTGNRRMGARLGQDIAYRYGRSAVQAVGPTISSVTYPIGGDGQELTVNVTHTSGTLLETADSGAAATDVIGFEASDDDFSTTLTITNVEITGASTAQINLASAPSDPATVKVRYLYGFPVLPASSANLTDILVDNNGVGDQGGAPVWPTFDPITATEFVPATTSSRDRNRERVR